MSKGKDFRPRKRGFDDDDGPMGFEPRSYRPPRQPFGGGDFGPPPGGMPMAPAGAAGPAATPVDATVKWFKGDKGFGFVELANGAGDAFLHIGALQSAGYESVPPGSKMKVVVTQGMKGAQVSRVLEVDTSTAVEPRPRFEGGGGGDRGGFGDRGARPPRRAPDPSTAVEVSGKVKWFDETKGFGFWRAMTVARTCSSISPCCVPLVSCSWRKARLCRCASSIRRKAAKPSPSRLVDRRLQ